MIWLLLLIIMPMALTDKRIRPCGNSQVLVTYFDGDPTAYDLDISMPSDTRDLILIFDETVNVILAAAIANGSMYNTGTFSAQYNKAGRHLQCSWEKARVDSGTWAYLTQQGILYLWIKDYAVPFSRGFIDLGSDPKRTYFHVEYAPVKYPRFKAVVHNFGYNKDSTTFIRFQHISADNHVLCDNPPSEFFDIKHAFGGNTVDNSTSKIDESCGRRKVVHTELIVHGQPTNYGDWPWHVAILWVEGSSINYSCGGTLLSKTCVLTAAHCASISGNAVTPGSLSVAIGKHNLVGGDTALQERQVFKVIIHPGFNATTLNNDIAILKLKSEAVFNEFVQPACLWHPDIKLTTADVFGTVVGWGFNHNEKLSSTLQQITIPIVSELKCLKSNPIFFQKKLNIGKFCAGFANGTSACNGDSGGGLMVFVPDTPGDASQVSGSWYVRGLVSLTLRKYQTNICDPDAYTIFTDVERYWDWVSDYLI